MWLSNFTHIQVLSMAEANAPEITKAVFIIRGESGKWRVEGGG